MAAMADAAADAAATSRSYEDAVKALFSTQHRGAALVSSAAMRTRTIEHMQGYVHRLLRFAEVRHTRAEGAGEAGCAAGKPGSRTRCCSPAARRRDAAHRNRPCVATSARRSRTNPTNPTNFTNPASPPRRRGSSTCGASCQ